MYNKIGSKLKTIAVAIMVAGLIGAFIVAVAFWTIAVNMKDDMMIGIFVGAGFVAGLMVAIPVVIGSLVLNGFGELIVISDDSNDCLRKLAGVSANNQSNVANNAYYNNSNTNSNVSGGWVCPKCGKANNGTGDFCIACGNKRA